LNTGIPIGYHGQIIRYMFSTKGKSASPEPTGKIGDPQVLAVLLCAVLTILLGLILGLIFGSILRV
jgi:NADH:ubiquinone oxidoreductase subunit 2 (subunit N)